MGSQEHRLSVGPVFLCYTFSCMKITLTVKERLLIPGVLKTQGKFEDMVAREEIVAKAKFNSEEVEKLSMKQTEAGSVVWSPENEATLELEITELELSFLKKSLKELSEQEKLPVDAISLWKKVNEEKEA
jgi:hypothetical protein